MGKMSANDALCSEAHFQPKRKLFRHVLRRHCGGYPGRKLEDYFQVPVSSPSNTAISAIGVNNKGNGIAYSYDASHFSASSTHFDLERMTEKVGDINLVAITTNMISDVSITYSWHGEYLFTVGKSDTLGLCGEVWDIRKGNLRQSLEFSPGDFRNFPLQSLSLVTPYVAVLTSNPRPGDGYPTYLRIYTQKGNEAFKFGSQPMICTALTDRVLILTMGHLFYLDLNDRYRRKEPESDYFDEVELEENWLIVNTSIVMVKNHQSKFFIWSWDGSERKAKCLGHLTSKKLPYYDEVAAFTFQNETITLIQEDGEFFTSPVIPLKKTGPRKPVLFLSKE
jgi:hypothetical protein